MGIKNTAVFLTGMMLFFALPFAKAQTTLDENCVVSVLNRTAQVKPYGSYAIPPPQISARYVPAPPVCRTVKRSPVSPHFLTCPPMA